MGNSAVSIRDVAEKAGVSLGTVSRVLNDNPSVRPDRRQRVKAAIADLDFHPDVFAQSLRRGTSKTFGIVIPDLRNPFFAELAHHVELAARRRGYKLLLACSEEDPALEAEHLESLGSRRVDGVVLAPVGDAAPGGRSRVGPLIVIDRSLEAHAVVAADHRGGARLATDYLLSLGHRRIGCVAGPANVATARERLAGFLDAVAAARARLGAAIDDHVVRAAFDCDTGRQAGEALLALETPPTAIFASSDQQAIGAMRAAADRGFEVPRRLSIVGFDGILVSDLVKPRLTTVMQPLAAIAEAAIERLVAGDDGAGAQRFACTLVIRESCAPAPDDGGGKPASNDQGR
jgi:LacI family transcriptional regulator